MMKLIPLTALALGLSSGVALADHRGGDYRSVVVEHRAAPVVRDHREYHPGPVARGWGGHGGSNVIVRGGGYREWRGGGREWRGGGQVYVHEPYYRGGFRRPIYVSRPIIRDHYYNYYRRPALIVENYNAMDGYYWVPGQWQWSGYEWIWQPGHYQPDPSYVTPGYVDPGYADPAY